jgi:hypothetical protein
MLPERSPPVVQRSRLEREPHRHRIGERHKARPERDETALIPMISITEDVTDPLRAASAEAISDEAATTTAVRARNSSRRRSCLSRARRACS